MKRQLTVFLLMLVLLLTMAGCSAVNAVQRLDAAEDMVEAKLDAVEEKVESGFRNAVSPASSADPAVPAPAPTAPAQMRPEPTQPPQPVLTESPRQLTEEEALQVALDHVGFTANQVTRLHTEYEIDDGIPQFDIEFHQGDWEYEFEIHAENGKIISYDKDHKYD